MATNEPCGSCGGSGKVTGFQCPGFRPVTMDCFECEGSGVMTIDRKSRLNWAGSLKAARMSHRMSLMEYAKWLGVRPHELSDAEHGRTDPREMLAKAQQRAVYGPPKEPRHEQ